MWRSPRHLGLVAAIAAGLALGCNEESPVVELPSPIATPTLASDAAPTEVRPDPAASSARSIGDYHLDDDPEPTQTTRARQRVSTRPIEIILRSTPPGATAAVDGRPIGKTPTFWAGAADGRPHDFTFSMPGYAVARYRFVATKSGIVHGTLRRFVHAPDAGPTAP